MTVKTESGLLSRLNYFFKMEDYKRKKYLSRKKYQFKYALTILIFVLIAAVASISLLYYELSRRFEMVNILEEISWSNYLSRMVVILGFAFLAGIFLSGKIVGPVFRLEKTLKEINSGKFNEKINLRKGDEFKETAREINILSEKLETSSIKNPEIKEIFEEKNKSSS